MRTALRVHCTKISITTKVNRIKRRATEQKMAIGAFTAMLSKKKKKKRKNDDFQRPAST